MIILVPILAALWPVVRNTVNQYNKSTSEAVLVLDKSLKDFEAKAAGLRPNIDGSVNVEQSLRDLKAVLDGYMEDYKEKTIRSPQMPRTWIAAFFAALLVVMAHSLYQVFAPEEVRKSSLNEYINRNLSDYLQHNKPTATLEQAQTELLDVNPHSYISGRIMNNITRTLSNVGWINNADKEEWFSQAEHILRKELRPNERDELFHLTWSTKFWQHFSGIGRFDMREILKKLFNAADANERENREAQLHISTVRRAAQVRYLRLASFMPVIISLSAVLYGMALYLIFSIIFVQTAVVMESAGMKPHDLFTWWEVPVPGTSTNLEPAVR
jgi:hypothetical protein